MKLEQIVLFVLTALLLTTNTFAITLDSTAISDVDDYGFFSQYSELEIESQTVGISSVELELTETSSSTVVMQQSYSGDDSTTFIQTLSFASTLTDDTEYDLTIIVTGTDASTQTTSLSGIQTDLISPDMQETTIPSEETWYTTESIEFEYEVDDGLGSGTLQSTINLVAQGDGASSTSEIVTSETTTHAATINADDLSEGTYSVMILARDNVGNYASSRIDVSEIYVDRTSPTVAWTTSQGTEFEDYTPSLEVFSTDNVASELLCDFYLNAILVEEDGSVTVGSAEIVLDTMTPGEYEAFVICEDGAANNVTSETLSFTILDIEEPTISINSPSISSVSAEDGITQLDIEFTVTDDVALADVMLTVTDSVQTQTLSTTEVSSGTFESTLNLSIVQESELQITVTANDTAANSAIDFTTVIYDITSPSITFVTADEGESNDGDFDVTFIPEDNVATDIACALHTGEVGESTSMYDFGTFASAEESTISITGIEFTGEYSYYIACADDVENAAGSDNQTFTIIDVTAPVLAFNSPENGDSFDASDSTMTATVTVTDDFELESSTVQATIVDSENNTISTVSASDIGSDQFEFTFDFVGQNDGWYTVAVVAEDSDANEGSSSIQIGYDTQAPTVELTTPSTIEQYSDMQFIITAQDTIATTMSCTVYLNDTSSAYYGAGVGTTYALHTQNVTSEEASTFEITKSIWDSVVAEQPNVGDHSFHAKCTDEKGLIGSSTTQISTFSDAEPVTTITSPSDLFSVGQGYVDGTDTLTISVESDDMIGSISFVELVILSDSLNNIQTMTDNGDGTYSYDLTDIVGLSDEEISLTAIAYDDLGSEGASDSIAIQVDTTNPVVLIDEPTILPSSDSNTLTVSVTDASVYTVVIADESGTELGSVSSTSFAEESVLLSYDTSTFADEFVVFVITATDAAGNEGEYTAEIWVDATAPTISEFTCNGVSQGASVDCTCTATDDSQSVALGSTVSTSITADTSTTGTVTAICTATDSQSNQATSETTFTVSSPVTSSSSGGGGGGGSSSSKAACEDGKDNDGDGLVDEDDPGCANDNDDDEEEVICRESWTCNDWSICSADGSQDRNCFDNNACQTKEARGQVDIVETSAMPDESRSCTPQVVEQEESVDLTQSTSQDDNLAVDSDGNAITGAITGGFVDTAKDLAKPAVIIFSIAVLAGLGVFVKKKWL